MRRAARLALTRRSTNVARFPLGAPALRACSGRQMATFAGLQEEADFTTDATFHEKALPLPVLRLLDEDGKLVSGSGELPFTLDEGVEMYTTMVRVSVVDQIMNSLQRQGRISFYMTGMGEEAAQVGTVAALAKDDVVWPQYRELGAFMHRGFTIQQVVDQCLGRADEPGKGRQMPVHYCDANLHMQAVTSPLATQVPQAVGAGYAFRAGGEARCAVAYFGDGAASEGDFAVALNFAATLKSQCIFICRNNGWAISTPAEEQYAGDGIAVRGIAYGMKCIRVDGNDIAAVFKATKKARALCVAGEPVVVELMTYRRGHHSTSDDSTKYRGGGEIKAASQPGLEPISRLRLLLEGKGLMDDAKEEALRTATRDEVMNALQVSEAKKFAPVSDMFTDVWEKETPQLKMQKEELFKHLATHSESYKETLTKYQS